MVPSRKCALAWGTACSYFNCVRSAICIICLKFIYNSTTFGNLIISRLSLPCKKHKLWWKTWKTQAPILCLTLWIVVGLPLRSDRMFPQERKQHKRMRSLGGTIVGLALEHAKTTERWVLMWAAACWCELNACVKAADRWIAAFHGPEEQRGSDSTNTTSLEENGMSVVSSCIIYKTVKWQTILSAV